MKKSHLLVTAVFMLVIFFPAGAQNNPGTKGEKILIKNGDN